MGVDVDGTKISAGCPRRFAAYATARPKFPPDAARTPVSSMSAVSMRLNAPRGLNDPVCWSSSSLRTSRPGAPNAFRSSSAVGVRRTHVPSRSLAFSTSNRVTSSGCSPGDKVPIGG